MSKKMKGVALDLAPYGGYEDAKARFKHQTLIQDYRELEKGVEAMRNKLETMKQMKLTLLAEVWFLRQRYKYLLKNKAAQPSQGRVPVQPLVFETREKNTVKAKTYNRKKADQKNLETVFYVNQKESIFSGKVSASRKPSLVLDVNQKDQIQSGKEATTLRDTTQMFDLNKKRKSYVRKEAAFRNPTPVIDLVMNEWLYSGKEAAPQNPGPAFDFNQIEKWHIGREDVVQSQALVFDLNQISGEEEELQDNYEPMRIEELKKLVIRDGTNVQHNDLKLSACRNAGNVPNQAGKQKISWQDQIALKV